MLQSLIRNAVNCLLRLDWRPRFRWVI